MNTNTGANAKLHLAHPQNLQNAKNLYYAYATG